MGLFEELKKKGLYRGYQRHVVMLEPVLRRMGVRGIPVAADEFARVEKLLLAELVARQSDMQRMVPDVVKPFHPKWGYKKVPKDLTGCVEREFLIEGQRVKRWAKLDDWTPSTQGLIRYMKYVGHEVPKALKTDRDTTNKTELRKMHQRTKDPLYGAVLRYRKAQTILSNHMENWKPGTDGRVHPSFYFDPATGQLSSRRPNAQNAPRHDDPEYGTYAREFRSMIKARPGNSLIEFDYSGFHVQTLGFEAQDADLMRIGRADLHSFVTAHFKKLPFASQLFSMPDAELRERLKWVKKNYKHERDAKVKHAILGYNNGMGYTKLYKQYEDYFENSREAKRILEFMDTLFPKAKAYREAICQKAHEQGYLISRHGYIRYFWEVFRWDGKRWSHGDDHEAALSFYTQNDAHGELKERILVLDMMGALDKYGFINTIHDSLMFECSNELLDECKQVVYDVMVTPSKVLIDPIVAPNGLVVDVEFKSGPDWVRMV